MTKTQRATFSIEFNAPEGMSRADALFELEAAIYKINAPVFVEWAKPGANRGFSTRPSGKTTKKTTKRKATKRKATKRKATKRKATKRKATKKQTRSASPRREASEKKQQGLLSRALKGLW